MNKKQYLRHCVVIVFGLLSLFVGTILSILISYIAADLTKRDTVDHSEC